MNISTSRMMVIGWRNDTGVEEETWLSCRRCWEIAMKLLPNWRCSRTTYQSTAYLSRNRRKKAVQMNEFGIYRTELIKSISISNKLRNCSCSKQLSFNIVAVNREEDLLLPTLKIVLFVQLKYLLVCKRRWNFLHWCKRVVANIQNQASFDTML